MTAWLHEPGAGSADAPLTWISDLITGDYSKYEGESSYSESENWIETPETPNSTVWERSGSGSYDRSQSTAYAYEGAGASSVSIDKTANSGAPDNVILWTVNAQMSATTSGSGSAESSASGYWTEYANGQRYEQDDTDSAWSRYKFDAYSGSSHELKQVINEYTYASGSTSGSAGASWLEFIDESWNHEGHAERTITESGSGVGLHVNFVDGSVSHFSEASGEGDADLTGHYEYDYSQFIDRPVNDEDYDYSSTKHVVSHDEYDDIQYSETNVASDGTILFNAMDFSTTVSGWRTTHDTWTVDGVTNSHVPDPETYGPTVLPMQQGFSPQAYFKQVTTYQTDPAPDDADFTPVNEFWLLSNTEMLQYGWEQGVAMAYSGDWIPTERQLDNVQMFLDTVGLIPGFGIPADAASGTISLLRGDWLGVGLSAVAIIPLYGDGTANVAKLARWGFKYGDEVAAFAKRTPEMGRVVDKIEEFMDTGCFVGQTQVVVPIQGIESGVEAAAVVADDGHIGWIVGGAVLVVISTRLRSREEEEARAGQPRARERVRRRRPVDRHRSYDEPEPLFQDLGADDRIAFIPGTQLSTIEMSDIVTTGGIECAGGEREALDPDAVVAAASRPADAESSSHPVESCIPSDTQHREPVVMEHKPGSNISAAEPRYARRPTLRRSVGALLLLLAGFCFWQGSDFFLSEPITEQTVAATPASTTPNPDIQPTGRSTSGVPLGTQSIEDIDVGQWVLSGNPTGEDDLQFGIEVDPATWRLLELRAPKTDGSYADVRMLRPLWWLELQTFPTFVVADPDAVDGIALVTVVDLESDDAAASDAHLQQLVGDTIYISVPECGIDGDARLLSIAECPEISPRLGPEFQVVTATFRHHGARVIDLSISGVEAPIGSTANHPFWSEDRQEFVRADELVVGERLLQSDGSFARLASVSTRPGEHTVYNLEVQVEHTYHVTRSGILVHNGDPCSFDLLDLENWTNQRFFDVGDLRGRQLPHEFSGSNIRRLRRDMRKNGFDRSSPIEIAIINGKKIIIDGHHRARAAGAAGIRQVPVIIRELSPDVARKYSLQAAEAAERIGLPF